MLGCARRSAVTLVYEYSIGIAPKPTTVTCGLFAKLKMYMSKWPSSRQLQRINMLAQTCMSFDPLRYDTNSAIIVRHARATHSRM